MRIGFIGLGTMGEPMARNLLKAGHEMLVWNRSEGKAENLKAAGAREMRNVTELAEQTDVIISMLADDTTTDDVLLKSGLAKQLKQGTTVINMATVSVSFAQMLEQVLATRQVNYLSAPVLGRVDVAEAGRLQIVVAGDSGVVNQAAPLLEAMGQKLWYFGPHPYQANIVKLGVNFMIASAIETMGEATALVQGHEVSGADFMELITSTLFAVPVYQGYGGNMIKENFEPAGFKLALGAKDVRLGLEAASKASIPMPVASAVYDQHLDALANGQAHWDWASLGKVAHRRAGQS
ncbi:NAD(P)-dependent oxidoreductase [Pokkaliibacter sp. CJK22405]|uniref:NAD(P)-dependent oxidoreductase n=1 Tax=Pokkaliibacter sp. CJK22405 TaxID=3384615 RepID=UPI0039850108